MRLCLLSVLPLALACGGPTLGDISEQDVTLTFVPIDRHSDEAGGTPTESEPAASAGQGGQSGQGGEPEPGAFEVTRALLRSSALTLVPCRAGTREIALDPRDYELFAHPSERVTTAVTELCSVRLDLAPGSADTTLEVEGKSESAGELQLTSDRSVSMTFDAAGEGGFGTVELLLGFDLATWLAGLPLPLDQPGAQSEKLADQLAGAAALYADRNRNGRLDADETEPLALGKAAR